jgi:roadblock/LC7 domain-containing protein
MHPIPELEPFDQSLYSEYSTLVIQLGYVVLFAPAFPIAALVSYVNTVTEMRSDAYKFLYSTQRPRLAWAQDIGSWQTVLWFMGTVGVFTNLGLLGLTARQLDMLLPFHVFGVWEVNSGNKASFIFLVEHVILAIQFAVAHYVPDMPRSVARAKALEEFETQAEVGMAHAPGQAQGQTAARRHSKEKWWDDAKDIRSELFSPAVPP